MRAVALFIVGMALPLAAASAQQGERQPSWEYPRIERLAWPQLGQFESEREYRNWVRDVRDARRDMWDDRRRAAFERNGIVVAQANVTPVPCDPTIEECPEEEHLQTVVVTGSRVQSANYASVSPVASITNNQSANVDEGDIVKRIGDYLVVLQDGRIFAANFRTMTLTDRIDVYRTEDDGYPVGADWYDEMLVLDDHIIVTAYSYEDEASELSVFRLDRETGRLERRGVFLISSEDYYDSSNYATRLVGDRLIIYSWYEPEDLVNRRNRPVVRRWVPDEEFDDDERGEPMLEVENIYRPVFGTSEPILHIVSICDLGTVDDDNLDCTSTGFAGGQDAEMFVSPDNVYLWTSAAWSEDYEDFWDCELGLGADPAPGVVFRLPLGRAEPDMLPIRGFTLNQFSMQQQGSRFRALLGWPAQTCSDDEYDALVPHQMELVDSSIGSFVTEYREAPDRRFTALPSINFGRAENRFIGDWLVYGARRDSGRPADPEEGEKVVFTNLVAVPLATPENAQVLALGHEVTRLEALGNGALVTGYLDETGLNVTRVALDDSAHITDSIKLEGRYESESRSHAFSAMPYPEGDGLMGLPTVRAEGDDRRYPWYSRDSQLSFMRFNADGQLADLGAVEPTVIDEEAIEHGYANGRSWDVYPNGYRCEVSCTDWYGNARPIFIERSVFALMGTELVQVQALEDSVEVLQRLDLTGELSD